MTLKDFFDKNTAVALAFSGGTDSSYLLHALRSFGVDVRPYFIKTAFQPQFELDDALRFCEDLGVGLKVLRFDILAVPQVVSNPENRCYHCKTALFRLLRKQAEQDGCTVLIDGTNASDNADERPGMRALRELDVHSPLRECGITKADILRLSRETGLPEKKSYSCLATRIRHGRIITNELLSKVESAENELFAIGFSDFRVRVFHDAAKLELTAQQMNTALRRRDEIINRLSPFFDAVLLDLRAR